MTMILKKGLYLFFVFTLLSISIFTEDWPRSLARLRIIYIPKLSYPFAPEENIDWTK